MTDEWTIIFSTTDEFTGELAKGLLKENGVDYVEVNKKDSSYLFGEIELFVVRNDILRAKFVLKDLDH